jgi:sensor histidine kinase regulating citrate/malate metabolism
MNRVLLLVGIGLILAAVLSRRIGRQGLKLAAKGVKNKK